VGYCIVPPDTSRAVSEVYRILRPDGVAKVMIYNKWSIIGAMLWFRYALLKDRPFMSLTDVYSRYLESPGNKAYTAAEARDMFSSFRDVIISTVLTHGDLLESEVGQRHRGFALSYAKII